MQNSPEKPWRLAADGAVLAVFVQPRASRNQLCGVQDAELKIRLTAPPVDGAANECCREYIAKLLKVSKSNVSLLSGETSRHKRFRISGVADDDMERIFSR